MAFLPIACAHAPAVGRGGPIYAITVESVNGRPTADSGSIEFPAVSIQVGDRFAQVWLADPEQDAVSPRILEGDAVALKDGVLVERSWSEAIVHQVTDEELAVGAAVIYVPGVHPTEVELRFDRVSPGSDRADRSSSQRLGKPTRRRITAIAATTSPETR